MSEFAMLTLDDTLTRLIVVSRTVLTSPSVDIFLAFPHDYLLWWKTGWGESAYRKYLQTDNLCCQDLHS